MERVRSGGNGKRRESCVWCVGACVTALFFFFFKFGKKATIMMAMRNQQSTISHALFFFLVVVVVVCLQSTAVLANEHAESWHPAKARGKSSHHGAHANHHHQGGDHHRHLYKTKAGMGIFIIRYSFLSSTLK